MDVETSAYDVPADKRATRRGIMYRSEMGSAYSVAKPVGKRSVQPSLEDIAMHGRLHILASISFGLGVTEIGPHFNALLQGPITLDWNFACICILLANILPSPGENVL